VGLVFNTKNSDNALVPFESNLRLSIVSPPRRRYSEWRTNFIYWLKPSAVGEGRLYWNP